MDQTKKIVMFVLDLLFKTASPRRHYNGHAGRGPREVRVSRTYPCVPPSPIPEDQIETLEKKLGSAMRKMPEADAMKDYAASLSMPTTQHRR